MKRGSKFNVPLDEYVVKSNFKNNQTRSEEYDSSKNIIDIACDKLIMDTENVQIYGEETDESIRELSADINKNGFKGAIMAYPITIDNVQKYQIESGHRRFMAAKLAGLSKIPVILTEAPKTDSQRRIRLISMNLHSRETLKPTVMANVISTLMAANREEQERSNQPTDIATLMSIVSSQVELSTKSIEKYRQIPKLIPALQTLADNGISWSALVQSVTLPPEKQESIAASIQREIERVGIENVSRQWIVSLITRVKQEMIGPTAKAKTVVKRRDGAKIIAKCVKDFDDIMNGNAVFKEVNKTETLENLKKIRECIDKKIEELNN